MDAFIGEIRLFPFTFTPAGWLPCDGRSLPVSSNTVLFSLIGSTYGGNGTTTFNLPLLVNYSALAAGQGPGLKSYALGEVNGTGQVNLITSQIPSHIHLVQAGNVVESAATATSSPANNFISKAGVVAGPTPLTTFLYSPTTDSTTLSPTTISPPAGATGSAHDNHQPYLALQYCICISGTYPQRP